MKAMIVSAIMIFTVIGIFKEAWSKFERLYCKQYNPIGILLGRPIYKGCENQKSLGQQYYQILLLNNQDKKKGKQVKQVKFYNGKLKTMDVFSYQGDEVTRHHSEFFEQENGFEFVFHRFYKAKKGTATYLKGALRVQLNMHNGKKYALKIVKKEQRYHKKKLEQVSYYGLENKLLMKVFYRQELISGYKIRIYKRDWIQEEYVHGKDRWVYFYDPVNQLELSFYFNKSRQGFEFSVYNYDRLLRKTKVRVYSSSSEKHYKNLVKLKMGMSRKKETWKQQEKSWELALKKKGWNNKVQLLKTLHFYGDSANPIQTELHKIEYYQDGSLKKVENYDPKSWKLDKIEKYNRFGERIFTKE